MPYGEFTPEEKFLFPRQKGGEFQIVLFYPNTYHVGASNLGFQTVYRLLNQIPGVLCERAFYPENPQDQILTMESRRPLSAFHLIAGSLSFELDIFNFIFALKNAGLPLLSAEREELFPLVMAGGALTFLNPEPLADLVDFFWLGEAETGLTAVIELLTNSYDREKNDLFKELSAIPGLYVPAFYHPVWGEDLKLKFVKPDPGVPFPLEPHFNPQFTPAYSGFISPQTEFSGSFLLEATRGCPHRCHFCGYSWNYPPFKPAAQETLKALIKFAKSHTDKIGLIASDLMLYRELGELCGELKAGKFKLGFSSFRADHLTPEFLDFLAQNGVKTLTLAPEAGSEKLRAAIGKPISDARLIETSRLAYRAGIKNLKLYFLLNLPGETDADLKAIPELVEKLTIPKSSQTISLSLNPLVPKPFTPLMWAQLPSPKLMQEKFQLIKKSLKGLAVSGESPKEALIQGILTRGGRELTPLIIKISGEETPKNFLKYINQSEIFSNGYTEELPKNYLFPFEHLRKKLDKSALYHLYLNRGS